MKGGLFNTQTGNVNGSKTKHFAPTIETALFIASISLMHNNSGLLIWGGGYVAVLNIAIFLTFGCSFICAAF